MHVNITSKIETSRGKDRQKSAARLRIGEEKKKRKHPIDCLFRSYSNTRTVAPNTGRSIRSPASGLRGSETMRSHETNASSMELARHASRAVSVPASTTNQIASTKNTDNTDTILSTTPNDVYQQVYHDDSSTHGSRTLDSRFSRDKYDLSDEESTDNDEENEEEQNKASTSHGSTANKPTNGSSSPRASASFVHADNADQRTDLDQKRNSKTFIEPDEFDKGKSLGIGNSLSRQRNNAEEEEEEDYSESNHKKENRVSLEIYHQNQKGEQKGQESDREQRYSASLKMYLNARHSSGASHSICITTHRHESKENEGDDERPHQQQQRSHSLQVDRSISMDFTRSPSSSSSSSILEPPPVERLVGSSSKEKSDYSPLQHVAPPMVIEIRSKPSSLPRMTDYIEYVDRRTLPSKDSLSWQDDTIAKDHVLPLYRNEAEAEAEEDESPEDSIELVRQVIESLLTRIVEEERQLLATVDRLVEQACSRALSLYLMERRVQLFAGSSQLPHHKSCTLRTARADKNHDNHSDASSLSSRLRTKSSPVIATTTDWTDVSRKLAAQTCFAAYPSGENSHELHQADFSTFSQAKLKFFNIISNDIIPSPSSISLPLPKTVAAVVSSSSSTRSSRASSVSSYASSMHVPCPPPVDQPSKRYSRPLSARLLDLSDDSDSNLSTSISTSLKTCILPAIVSVANPLSPLPPPPLRTQRRHPSQQQQSKRRSIEDLNSSSDDSLSNHLNKAAGFCSVFVPRNHHK